ncbi:hypothetical protein WMY93_024007 [Mugilogobius chulae]|uniref:chymotrypsin n=1 Tax=Mugilogobius chulae TaxID=88201 RepID=A0AAW0NI88_9GOBI
MKKTTAALVFLYLWTNTGTFTPPPGSKCGAPQVWSSLVHALRVVGGVEATQGSHPWLVSLRKKGLTFCGGAILSEHWIMTAAHCFSSTSRESFRSVRVVIGDFDQHIFDEEEQVFTIKGIFVHEKYHHTLPMNYDIALLELNQPIQLGKRVQPVCLPLRDDHTQPDTNCIVAGWGRTKERGHLSSTLREVQLNLVEPAKCKYVLQTVKSSMLSPQRLNRPPPALTVLCAGPETGGRDAWGLGGPLVCPVGSAGGHWVALGVTSWGKGCGRSWELNNSRPPSQRGSPGVFTDVKLMLPWIKLTLRHAELKQLGRPLSRLCSVQDGSVTDTEGVIRNPASQHRYYDNNQLCVWSINVPAGYSILIEIEHLDLENDSYCLYDRLTLSVGPQKPVGILCGVFHPRYLFLNNSHHASVFFSSDVSAVGTGFTMKYRAVPELTDPGCDTVVLVQNESNIHSPGYPQHYMNNCMFRWVIYAPQGHIIKLSLTDFELEESSRCLYDSLAVFGDLEGTEDIAVLCGISVPPPVISYHSVMVLQFTSDSSVTHRGFRAHIEFIHHSDLHQEAKPCEKKCNKDLPDDQIHTTQFDSLTGQRRVKAADPQQSSEAFDYQNFSYESSGMD